MSWKLGNRTLDFADRVQIMGILNVTPDSFFDGGRYLERQAAVQAAEIAQLGGDAAGELIVSQIKRAQVFKVPQFGRNAASEFVIAKP